MMNERLFYAIVGPTACGKTELSLLLAERMGCDILCVDAMQVYRGLDVGTAKPTREERTRVTHYGLDLASPLENFSASRFEQYAEPILESCRLKRKPLILCGGTGLYYRALLEGFFSVPDPDPELRAELMERVQAEGSEKVYDELNQVDPSTASGVHPNDGKRIVRALEIIRQTGKTVTALRESQQKKEWIDMTCFIGLRREREELLQRIEKRTEWMYNNGLVEETRQLIELGCTEENTALQAIGYKECYASLKGVISLEDAFKQTILTTRQYAKRQMTWFRRQFPTQWICLTAQDNFSETVEESLRILQNSGMNKVL